MTDMLPMLVQDFVEHEREGLPLLREFKRNVAAVARTYPDAYFALGQKTPEAIDDLAHRAFTICARVPKGRFPFLGRAPFRAFLAEGMDGRNIRYHSFYARLSITRELLRDEYASNVVRDPALRWRAELYREVGRALAELAEPLGARKPQTWRLRGQGLVRVRSPEFVIDELRGSGLVAVPALVERALSLLGPSSQSRLAGILGEVLSGPVTPEAGSEAHDPDPSLTLSVRGAVREAWEGLDAEARDLLVAVASGAPYDELLLRFPRFAHKVALTRAVGRCNEHFLARVYAAVGGERGTNAPPQQLAETILEVLLEMIPDLATTGELS